MSDFIRSSMPETAHQGRNRTKSFAWAIPVILIGAAFPAEASDINGNWARGDGNARVRIAPCGADICAVNTWIRPGTPKEKEGDKLVMSIKEDSEGSYFGTAFDPQRDLSYKLTVKVDGDRMTTKGCVIAGLICKGVDWTRIN
ncbi:MULTISPECIES: DUF2147 domain-containing protein [unclassified Rhizobium]|jgi:uncharacterized protein (DUF2147 family)|uniref:DUF2147 domain-containing protein n=1 Tax=unclassified Rhizobium TaxID=2613769 RepID=UPI000FF83992|nr:MULTISPECIES: DUF2147 domain-containing protein [unclassified Rhizobium]RKD35709.1 uncharacterized protein (DUF2147 family) [Rhizobium sp. WW_1]